MQTAWPASLPPCSIELEAVTKRRRTDEGQPVQEQIIGILREAEAGAKTRIYAGGTGPSDGTFCVHGRFPAARRFRDLVWR
jgi:hypothetical protein